MNTEEDKKKLNQQATQVFNVAERSVMTFISKFLKEPPSVIFKDDMPKVEEPVILKPFDEYKKGVYLKFTLRDLRLDDPKASAERANKIESLLEHQNVKDALGFILYCIKCVYSSVVTASMINSKPMANINLELDENKWVFIPKYMSEETAKKSFLELALGKIVHIKNQKDAPVPSDMMKDMDEEYKSIVESLGKINITDEILAEEKNINDGYLTGQAIGIFVEELTKYQLPKPNFNSEDLLPLISSSSYEDPV